MSERLNVTPAPRALGRLAFWVTLLLPLAVGIAQTALSPADAVSAIQLPPGFQATLFAAEPAITQPMSFTFDDRGRVWVVECLSYPTWNIEGQGQDRVTILEDTDHDGRHDKRTVFFDQGVNLSSVEVGFGGVWLTAVPNLIFIPDANGDDKPDGPPRVVLDGFDLKARHNVVGNLAWGPDGWLYGCNGILSNSLVGKPGAPNERRVPINCGVWRYHPVRQEFEAYAHGTTNPWGLDWDDRGQLFVTNCVIKHLFHFVPGGHYERMYGQDLNPNVYGLLQSCADHQHWAGGHWTTSRGGQGAHSDAGGGHAHSGCMVYLGDNWPEEYRGNVFAVNIHGQRLNRDVLKRSGSGYVASHLPDFAFSKDPWFRGLHAKYGPDGAVYVTDWSDIGECHDQQEEQVDRTGGRIFKISYGQPKEPPYADLAKATSAQLVALQSHANEWQARHARRILQERVAKGRESAKTLRDLFEDFTDPEKKNDSQARPAAHLVRLLYTAYVTGQLDEAALAKLIVKADDETVRALAVRLACERHSGTPVVQTALAAAATMDSSPFVRLHVASALQRVPLEQRWPIAEAIVAHAADAQDANLPLFVWYAVEPLVARSPRKAIELLSKTEIPLVREHLSRRAIAVYEAAGGERGSSAWVLDELLRAAATAPDAARSDILRGIAASYRGRREVAAPKEWLDYYASLATSRLPGVRQQAQELAVKFGDQRAIATLNDLLMKRVRGTLDERRQALTLLTTRRDPEFGRSLLSLLRDDALRPDVIRELAAFDLPEIPPRLIALYPSLTPAERQDVLQTLTARPASALVLLAAIENEVIPRRDVSALIVRQVEALGDKTIQQRLTAVWGQVRPASDARRQRTAELKSLLTPETLQSANSSNGRALFVRNCATCHKLFGEGTPIGPELTGSQRANLDYILENVLDPSALVPREHKVNVVQLADGRVVQGIVAEETPSTLTLRTANDTVYVATSEIENRRESPQSMMPEGLFDKLTPDEIRDLIAYLASPAQVPLPAGTQ